MGKEWSEETDKSNLPDPLLLNTNPFTREMGKICIKPKLFLFKNPHN